MQDQPSADQETAALKLPPHSLEAEQSGLCWTIRRGTTSLSAW